MQTVADQSAGDAGPTAGEGWVDSGKLRLFRRWRRPAAGQTIARLVVVHGYGDHAGRYGHIMDWLADRGVATDAVDLRGHGRSPGRRGFVRGWAEYLDDLRAHLRAERADATAAGTAGRPLFVLGHSHGGLVAAVAGTRGVLAEAGVAGCVLSAPYLRPAEPLTPLWRAVAAVTNVVAPALRVPTGLTTDMMSGDPAMAADSRIDPLLLRHATPRWYATAMRAQDEAFASAGRFRLPLLCLIGDADPIASLAGARAFVDRAGSADKALEVVPNARHEILREVDRERTYERVLSWVRARAG